MEFEFAATVWQWRGPAPYHFITVPDWACEHIAPLANVISYGWGMIPVQATIGGTTWTTAMFAKDGGYVLPVKDAVRRAEEIAVGSAVEVTLTVSVG